ncbi:MAG: glycosyl transferase, partial [Proteobacteria bacterium]|nr:glycosyl transferase [Pseudomonadota bacterium]
KFINAEPDIVLSTLLFSAFYIWWRGTTESQMTAARWVCVTILIALSGLTKGPQPVAYFSLGVGAYILLKQRNQIPAFFVANLCAGLIILGWYVMVYQPGDIQLWENHSRLINSTQGLETVLGHLNFAIRLFIEFLPGPILIGPALVIAVRGWRGSKHDLLLAVVLYSLLCTVVLLFWPGKITARYAMPGTMALALVCGLMFERLRDSRRKVVISALFVTYLIFGGLLVRAWIVMPLFPHLFRQELKAGATITDTLQKKQEPFYVIQETTNYNMLVNVKQPIHAVLIDDLAKLKTPAIAAVLPAEEILLHEKNSELRLADITSVAIGKYLYKIIEINPPRSEGTGPAS